MIRKIITFFISTVLFTIFACCTGNEDKSKDDTMNTTSIRPENNKVRLSVITIDPAQLDTYNTFLKE